MSLLNPPQWYDTEGNLITPKDHLYQHSFFFQGSTCWFTCPLILPTDAPISSNIFFSYLPSYSGGMFMYGMAFAYGRIKVSSYWYSVVGVQKASTPTQISIHYISLEGPPTTVGVTAIALSESAIDTVVKIY